MRAFEDRNQLQCGELKGDEMMTKRLALIAMVALLLLCVRPAAADYSGIYWTTYSGPRPIYRSDLDGTNQEKLIQPSYGPFGIAVDEQSGEIYWSGHGHIMKAHNDGSAPSSVASVGTCVYNIALDDGFLYYNSYGYDGNHGIGKVATDGTASQLLYACDGGEGLTFDSTHQEIYYESMNNYKLWKMKADGSSLPQSLGPYPSVKAMTIDEVNGYL